MTERDTDSHFPYKQNKTNPVRDSHKQEENGLNTVRNKKEMSRFVCLIYNIPLPKRSAKQACVPLLL